MVLINQNSVGLFVSYVTHGKTQLYKKWNDPFWNLEVRGTLHPSKFLPLAFVRLSPRHEHFKTSLTIEGEGRSIPDIYMLKRLGNNKPSSLFWRVTMRQNSFFFNLCLDNLFDGLDGRLVGSHPVQANCQRYKTFFSSLLTLRAQCCETFLSVNYGFS